MTWCSSPTGGATATSASTATRAPSWRPCSSTWCAAASTSGAWCGGRTPTRSEPQRGGGRRAGRGRERGRRRGAARRAGAAGRIAPPEARARAPSGPRGRRRRLRRRHRPVPRPARRRAPPRATPRRSRWTSATATPRRGTTSSSRSGARRSATWPSRSASAGTTPPRSTTATRGGRTSPRSPASPAAPEPLPPLPASPGPAGAHAVQVLRTYPSKRPRYGFAPDGERSIARAYVKAFRRARRLIYVEDQYLWSATVAVPLADALRTNPDLHLIALVPRHPEQGGRLSEPPELVGHEAGRRPGAGGRRRPRRRLRPGERRRHAGLRARQGLHRRRRLGDGRARTTSTSARGPTTRSSAAP